MTKNNSDDAAIAENSSENEAATEINNTASSSAPRSVLAQGEEDWLPEKYRVTAEDGTLDLESSAKKVAEAHKNLERRLGVGEAPPRAPDEYAPEIAEEAFNWDNFKSDPEMQSFLKGAHSRGINNEQLSYVLGEYFERASTLVEGAQQLDTESASKALGEHWQSPDDFERNITLAHRAFSAYVDASDRDRINEIGNNPIVLKILANVGKEMAEDVPVTGIGVSEKDFGTRAAEIRTELEKMPRTDPGSAALKSELNTLYNRRYGSKPQRLGMEITR